MSFHKDDPTYVLDSTRYNVAMQLTPTTEDMTPTTSIARVQYYLGTKENEDSPAVV